MTSTVNRCALLFGVPVTQAQFLELLAISSDYVCGMLRSRDPNRVWAEDYAHVADAAQALIGTARTLGVAVFEKATLRDLSIATERYDSVIVCAHWRGVIVREADIIGDFLDVAHRLRTSAVLAPSASQCSDAGELVSTLNELIVSRTLINFLPEPMQNMARNNDSLGQTLCRDLVDEELTGVIKSGNQIELFGRLHSPAEFEEAFAPVFAGELDLALCHSAGVASLIELRRGVSIRHLHRTYYVAPGPEYVKIRCALRIMSEQGGSYIPARLRVEEAEQETSQEYTCRSARS